MNTALFSILFRPFDSWKFATRTLRIARERGFETVVAWDHRNSRSDFERIRVLADTVVPFHSTGNCEPGYAVMRHVRSDFALIISDDEEASPALWDFAARPPSPSRFGIPVIPILGERMYRKDIGIQERLVWTDGWSWVGGFEGHSEGAPQVYLDRNPGVIVWHHCLEAPREEREAKAARYAELDPHTDHRSRLIWEEHESDLVPMNEMRRYL